MYLAELSLAKGENSKANHFLKEAEVIAKSSGFNDILLDAYRLISIPYMQTKDFESASHYQHLYITLKDSIKGEELMQNLASVQSEFEQQKNLSAIANKEILLQRQLYLSYAMGTIAILVGLLGFVYYKSNQRSLRNNKALSLTKAELERQNQEMLKINNDLMMLNNEKNNLIGIVAHDLKSPLNQIKGLISIIKLSPPDETETMGFMQMMENSATRMTEMIGKILDVEAIESKQLNLKLESVNFSEVVKSIADRFTIEAQRKQIQLHTHVDENIIVKVDRGYTDEVIENLLSNALKFSPAEKNIYINITSKDNAAVFEIRDEGPGLTEDDKKKMFGKYQRLSALPTGNESSTGLGLSIVKKFVEAMKGEIWCESDAGKGASFFVRFELVN